MLEVVKHPDEDDHIELLLQPIHIVSSAFAEIHWKIEPVGAKPRLRQQILHYVDADSTAGAASFHFKGKEAGVAANIENGLSLQIPWYNPIQDAPAGHWIVGIGGVRADAWSEFDIVIPGAKTFQGPDKGIPGGFISTFDTIAHQPH